MRIFGSRAAGFCAALALTSPAFAGAPAVSSPTPAHSAIDATPLPPALAAVHPNEAGQIPVLLWHNIIGDKIKNDGVFYPLKMFKEDLQFLYDHQYYPVSLSDFVIGKLECPAGKTPVVLTFDDSVASQFTYLPDGAIDPNCVVGVLDAFHDQHPDWPNKATFFLIMFDPKSPMSIPFGQIDKISEKLRYLVSDGFEIGNHTVHHLDLSKLSDDAVKQEIGACKVAIEHYLPDYSVDLFAVPGGHYPKNSAFAQMGFSHGGSYYNKCIVAYDDFVPSAGPMDIGFDPLHVERITAGVASHRTRWWLAYLEQHPELKFVSDGDPDTYTVDTNNVKTIDTAKLAQAGLKLRVYPAVPK